MQSWPIHEAKARLSELVKRAQQQPQQLTSHGEPGAVVLSSEQVQTAPPRTGAAGGGVV